MFVSELGCIEFQSQKWEERLHSKRRSSKCRSRWSNWSRSIARTLISSPISKATTTGIEVIWFYYDLILECTQSKNSVVTGSEAVDEICKLPSKG
ncbi:hypothetical protein ABKV19_013068 [Rosa sericea]